MPAVRNPLHSAHSRSGGLGVDVFVKRNFFSEVDSSKVLLSNSSASRIPRFFALHGHCIRHLAFEEMHFLSQPEGWGFSANNIN